MTEQSSDNLCRMRRALWLVAVAFLWPGDAFGGGDVRVRGQIATQEWTVTSCDTRDVYRVVFPSSLAFKFQRELDRLGVSRGEPVVAGLRGTIIPSPSTSAKTIGVLGFEGVRAGACREAPDGPGGSAGDAPEVDPWVTKSIVIVKSTRTFPAAKAAAAAAASRLNLKLDLRGLSESKRTGLTCAQPVCDENGFSYPCYVARGRYDDGVYVSVEHSNAYRGFAKGLYIVVVASGAPNDPGVRDVLARARKAYADAYSKTTKVYMGCIH